VSGREGGLRSYKIPPSERLLNFFRFDAFFRVRDGIFCVTSAFPCCKGGETWYYTEPRSKERAIFEK